MISIELSRTSLARLHRAAGLAESTDAPDALHEALVDCLTEHLDEFEGLLDEDSIEEMVDAIVEEWEPDDEGDTLMTLLEGKLGDAGVEVTWPGTPVLDEEDDESDDLLDAEDAEDAEDELLGEEEEEEVE